MAQHLDDEGVDFLQFSFRRAAVEVPQLHTSGIYAGADPSRGPTHVM